MSRAVVVLTAIMLWAGAARGAARKRIVVLPFDGPHAAALRREVIALLETGATVVATDAWIAKQAAADGIITGRLEQRGMLHLELRDGVTRELVGERAVARADLRDELASLLDDLDVSIADGDDDDDDDATPPAPTAPVRVAVQCETDGDARTKACPAFLLGFIDAHDVLLGAPRSSADVILYASVTEVALVDHVHLRFVGRVAGAPPIVETDAELDTRADDDTQRTGLEPAFLRGIGLFVAARHPDAVTVALGPTEAPAAVADTSPWDIKLEVGGFGNWSDQYQSYSGTSDLSVARLTPTSRLAVSLHADGGLDRQPALALPDGRAVSVNTSQWRIGGGLHAAELLDDHWSLGGAAAVSRDDPDGQYDYTASVRGGIEWDSYPATDPRGNRLAILYVAGYQVDRYNLRDVLGETSASYPIHELIASGTVRADKVGIGIALSIGAELLEPERRNSISASPFVQWKLGEHVDLDIALSITRRELPAPDPAQIDPADYGLLSRLSYAQPFAMTGSVSLSIHSDRTNGARNDRFTDL